MPGLLFIIVLVLLGGGTLLWTQGIALLGIGVFVFISPPSKGPGIWADAAILGLLAMALAGFLPFLGLLRDSWWMEAAKGLGIDFPHTLSVQPYRSMEALVPLLGGIAWLYAAISWEVGHETRKRLLWAFAISMGVLSIGIIAGTLLQLKYPFASTVHNFSYFPNRNQTSSLLVMGGVVSFGMMIRAVQRRRRLWAVTGIICTGIIFFALIYSLSRAGIILFVVGCLIWIALSVYRSNTARIFLLASSGVLMVCSLLVFFGGSTTDRIGQFITAAQGDTADFRMLIYEDSGRMIKDLPLAGAGLSNFSVVFPQYREASVNHNSILHPESDWLWLGAELGIPGLLCALIALGALLKGLNFSRKYRRHSNALVAVAALLIFALHSMVDVAGHRLGTFLAAAWLYGIARHTSSSSQKPLWMSPQQWRVGGVILALCGIAWIAAEAFSLPWHSSVVLKESEAMLRRDSEAPGPDAEEVRAAVDRAVRRYPLDWRAYFNRAQVRLYRLGEPELAMEDFRRARFLEPIAAQVPYYEGLAWLPFQPILAASAWREALARETDDRALIYRGILSNAQYSPEVAALVADLSLTEPDFRYQFLGGLRGNDYLSELNRDLARNSALESFSHEQAEGLLKRWLSFAGPKIVGEYLERHPDLARKHWLLGAEILALQNNFQQAMEVIWSNLQPPAIPDFRTGEDLDSLRRELLGSPSNLAVSSSLLKRQVEFADWPGAERTLAALESQDPIPPFVRYWRSRMQFEKGYYKQSWNSIKAYVRATAAR